MPLIREVIVTTQNPDGLTHIAPMGIKQEDNQIIISPFKPSTTLTNLERSRVAVVNRVEDVRIFAGCLTGRYDWPLNKTELIDAYYLSSALSHLELEVERIEEDELRPKFYCKIVNEVTHAPFTGYNRAAAAVLEAAILVSRLNMLPKEKVEQEIEYLTIAIKKTAGEHEQEAWNWLMEKVETFYADSEKSA